MYNSASNAVFDIQNYIKPLFQNAGLQAEFWNETQPKSEMLEILQGKQ